MHGDNLELPVSRSARTRPGGAVIACPVCGRPARAVFIRTSISHILCRRCHAAWRLLSAGR